ncbi:MAG: cytidylate kinase-like family protein [Chloroflexi bacterium]|nr:cytidylate kinase-like family protein [Chloroflexota bacterium]
MPVVTIARQLGSGGEGLAARVGQQLGARVLDSALLEVASERSGIPLPYLQMVDERGRSVWRRPIDLVRLVPLPPIDPDVPDVLGDRYPPTGPVLARGEGLVAPAYWAYEAYAALLARTMRAAATEGDAVIVGRAGNVALAGFPGALHVLVVANAMQRVRHVAGAFGVDAFDALDLSRESDRQRAAHAKQFFGVNWLDPLRYDLVINTDAMRPDAAAEVIAGAARARAAMAAGEATAATAAPTGA